MNDKLKTKESNYYVNRTGMESYNENPWLKDLTLTIKTKNKISAIGKNKKLIDATTGEILDESIAIVHKKEVDKEEFVKVFSSAISGMFELSKTAQDMFKIILQIYLEQNFQADRVYISETTLKKFGYTKTKTTRQNAINQLLDKKFIALMEGEINWYWINPNMIYKGDRLTLVQDYVIKGTKSAELQKKIISNIENKSEIQHELKLED